MLCKIDKVKLVDPSLDEVLVIGVISVYDYLSAFKLIKLKILQGKLANLTLIIVGVIVTKWV